MLKTEMHVQWKNFIKMNRGSVTVHYNDILYTY